MILTLFMEVSKSITQKIAIPDDLSAVLKQEVTGIPVFASVVERYIADTSLTVTKIVEIILACAIHLSASDIHLESQEKEAKLRVRLDGVLQDVITVSRKSYELILSRIKLLSEMKLNIADRPQDGRFSILIEGISVEIRSSILPAEYGESIVLRILNPKSLIGLEQSGLRKDLYDTFISEINRPNGMIIVTGPTGSGKTTTLYAFLKKIQNPEIKIITIEDPIEYHLQGISQTQVDPSKGYNFASGLRAIVRQDPDVILVGEIRDLETVDIALQAALTGHLVLTTLHTNDASGTTARLVSLGAKSFNIAPALNMIVAQRLVRKICPDCGTLEPASPEDLSKIKKAIEESIPSLEKKGVVLPKLDENLKLPVAKGCDHCNRIGYRDRVGIHEALLVDDEIEKFILTDPPAVTLKEMALKKGMLTMYQDGIIKALLGVTTLEEVERVAEG